MDLLASILAVVGPLLGVVVGAALTHRKSDQDWMRDRRAELYLQVMDVLDALLNIAAVERRVIRFKIGDPETRPDYQEVEDRFDQLLELYKQTSTRISVLGGQVSQLYNPNVHILIGNLINVFDDPQSNPGVYERVLQQGLHLRIILEVVARYDLGNMGRWERWKMKPQEFKTMLLDEYKDGDFVRSSIERPTLPSP